MDIVNFPAIIEKYGILSPAEVDTFNDLLLLGKKVNNLRDGSQYQNAPIRVKDLFESICSLNLGESYELSSIVTYNHPTAVGSANFDLIASNLKITRGLAQPLFNVALEGSYSLTSPAGTEWFYNPTNLAQVKNLTYDTLTNLVTLNLGGFASIPGTSWVMHDTINDKYYYITFLTWQSGGGGEFSYQRQEIYNICDGCIHFPDGTKLCTAPSVTPPAVTIPATDFWVDTVLGNDGTALPNRFDKPYKTIAAANTAATGPATIYVRPGTYPEAPITVKNNVEFFFEPGCVMSAGGFRDLGAAITTRIKGNLRMTSSAGFNFTGASNIIIEIESMATTIGSAINIVPGVGISRIYITARNINSSVTGLFQRFINMDRQGNLVLNVTDFMSVQRPIEFRFAHDGNASAVINCPNIIIPSAPLAGAFQNTSFMISASGAGVSASRANLTINGNIVYAGADKTNEHIILIKDGNLTLNGNITANGFSGLLFVGNQGILPAPATTHRIKGDIISDRMSIMQNHSTATILIQQGLIKTAGIGGFPYAITMGNDDAFPADPGGRIYLKDCRVVNTNAAATGVIIANNGAGSFGEVYSYNTEIYNQNLASGEAILALAPQNAGLSNVKSNVINSAFITNLFGAAPGFVTDPALIIPQV